MRNTRRRAIVTHSAQFAESLAVPRLRCYVHARLTTRIDVGLWLVGVTRLAVILQAPGAAVAGTITSAETGVPVVGAEIALPDLGRVAMSDDRGRYVLRDVAPGPQHLSVRRIGFAPRMLHALVPRIGELDIDIALARTALRLKTVNVRPSVAVRGLDGRPASDFDRTLSMAAVRDHPMLSEPDAFVAASGGNIVLSPEMPSGMHVRGGASDETSFLLDGIPILNPYHAAGTFSAWNPDALERLTISPPSPARPEADALSGVVAAVTRAPSDRLGGQGSISTTQARVTLDGPLGFGHAGFLASVRTGFPGFAAPKREPTYLAGRTDDALVAVDVPVLGGRVRALAYGSANDLRASATTGDSGSPGDRRNAFSWRSRSAGGRWSRGMAWASLTLSGWRATSDVDAAWGANGDAERMDAGRREEGFSVTVDRAAATKSAIGLQLRRSATSYLAAPRDSSARYALTSRTPFLTLFGSHERPLSTSLTGSMAMAGVAAAGHVYARSYSQLRWAASSSVTLSAAYLHGHQFAQSLRNAESIVGAILPVDLYAAVGASGIPVARSDDGVLAAEYRPLDGVRLGAEYYTRTMGGLVLAAPRTSAPFADSTFAAGSATVRGFSLDAAASGARYGFVASYGWQHGRLAFGDSSFVPGYATTQLVETGVIAYPSATSSIRLGVTGAAGRRATAIAGGLEWESCNALDRGCEFGGSPRASGALGGAALPPYLRVDVGVRKHWHVDVHDHDALVAVFGTVTNVFGRANVLTFATDPTAGEPTPVAMRPLAPLVVGIDWRF